MSLKNKRLQKESVWSVAQFVCESALLFRWHLLGMIAVMVGWSIELTVRPYITRGLCNAVIRGNSPENIALVSLWVIAFCVSLGAIILLFRAYDWLVLCMEPALRKHIATRVMGYTLGHSHEFYQQHMSGSLTNKVNDIVRGVPQMVKICIERFFTIGCSMIIALLSMWYFHTVLALVMASWVALFILASILVARRSQELADAASDAHAHATGCITDTLSNMLSVRLFASAGCEEQLLNRAFIKTADSEYQRDLLSLKVQAFQTISFFFLNVISLAILMYGFSVGSVTAGDFILVLGINLSLIWVLWGLVENLTNFIKVFGEVSQGLRILGVHHDMVDLCEAKPLLVSRGCIQFDRVSFTYPNGERVFEDFSVMIEPGQKVGLVGYSGSGKSTFVNLILRLFDIDSGKISIDGQNIAMVTQESLRRSIALIPQDPSLFNRSLGDNIRYGRWAAAHDEVLQAAKYAHADLFIERLSSRYDTLVGERGLMLSGGQRQRIAIARAFLKQAPILLLDEATSALDSITESYIQESLYELMRNRTTIVIAHRLSTLKHMDRILIFDKGRLVEDGTHDSLLAQRGMYSALWNAQVCGFLPNTHEAV